MFICVKKHAKTENPGVANPRIISNDNLASSTENKANQKIYSCRKGNAGNMGA